MDVVAINTIGHQQLTRAESAPSGRSALTVYGRSGARLRQTVVALAEGQVMGEHKSPGDASLFCVDGRVIVHAGGHHAELARGDLVALPPQRHDVEAVVASILLLTVALH
jgi:quercetin dioxygenase-like cupin family protein